MKAITFLSLCVVTVSLTSGQCHAEEAGAPAGAAFYYDLYDAEFDAAFDADFEEELRLSEISRQDGQYKKQLTDALSDNRIQRSLLREVTNFIAKNKHEMDLFCIKPLKKALTAYQKAKAAQSDKEN